MRQTGERWSLGRKSTLSHSDSREEKKKPEKGERMKELYPYRVQKVIWQEKSVPAKIKK